MKILFVQTGGTIDKDYPRTQKGYAFEIDDPAVVRILEKLNPTFEYQIISAFRKDSQEIIESDRQLLLEICQNSSETHIIITHGTDTMIETAIFLQSIPNKTIVLTGAMRPERFSNSDASIHIGMAITAVQILPFGVYIAMHGNILKAHEASRDLETGQFIDTNLS